MSTESTRVYEHIVVRDAVPRIAGTRYKVAHLVQERLAYGWSPEELQYQHPDLSMGQVSIRRSPTTPITKRKWIG